MKMKFPKVLLASAAACALVALPLRAQQPAKDATPQEEPQISKVTVQEESDAYTLRREYLLGPSDLLELRVMNEPQMNGVFEVDADGNVEFPFIDGPIRARCRSVRDVQKDATAALSKFLKNPRVFVNVKEQRSHKPAFVYGAVAKYQQYEMHRPARLLELLSYSGGVTEQHSGTIQITHTEPPMCDEAESTTQPPAQLNDLGQPFSVYKVSDLKQGKPEANPYIRNGDIVYVAEASPIYVVGNVLQPANLYLRDGMTLQRVLAQVGGVREANEEKVRIYRQKPGGSGQEVLVANYRAIKQGKEADIPLQPYDIVEVPKRGAFDPKSIASVLGGLVRTGAGGLATNAPLRILY